MTESRTIGYAHCACADLGHFMHDLFFLDSLQDCREKMDEIERIIRDVGQQQAHNAYYRDCYALFKLLQDLTEEAFNELQSLYRSDTSNSNYSVHQTLWKLQNTICSLVERACEAQAAWEELCPVNATFSARDVLEPIRRIYTDPNAASLGRKRD